MIEKGRAENRPMRGVSNHRFIDSIYFEDPNGYVIELACKRGEHDAIMDPAQNKARALLAAWQTRRAAASS